MPYSIYSVYELHWPYSEYYQDMAAGLPDDKHIFARTIIYTDQNQRTRFIPETEPSEP